MVASGRLGRLLSAEAVFVTSSVAVRDPAEPPLLVGAPRPRDPALAGLPLGRRAALGERRADRRGPGDDGQRPRRDIDVEDAISVAFRFSGGGLGTMHFVNAFPRPNSDGYLAFRGVDGSAKVDTSGALTIVGPGLAREPAADVETRTYEFMEPGRLRAELGRRDRRACSDGVRDGHAVADHARRHGRRARGDRRRLPVGRRRRDAGHDPGAGPALMSAAVVAVEARGARCATCSKRARRAPVRPRRCRAYCRRGRAG